VIFKGNIEVESYDTGVMISGNQNLKKDVAKSPKQMFSRNIF
jgi:hypothetical protein